MWLNKELCKRCRAARAMEETQRSPRLNKWVWQSIDDKRWRDGWVKCVMAGSAEVLSPPPQSCPYAAEHVVSQETGNEAEQRGMQAMP